jgi:hypothetical protein
MRRRCALRTTKSEQHVVLRIHRVLEWNRRRIGAFAQLISALVVKIQAPVVILAGSTVRHSEFSLLRAVVVLEATMAEDIANKHTSPQACTDTCTTSASIY